MRVRAEDARNACEGIFANIIEISKIFGFDVTKPNSLKIGGVTITNREQDFKKANKILKNLKGNVADLEKALKF